MKFQVEKITNFSGFTEPSQVLLGIPHLTSMNFVDTPKGLNLIFDRLGKVKKFIVTKSASIPSLDAFHEVDISIPANFNTSITANLDSIDSNGSYFIYFIVEDSSGQFQSQILSKGFEVTGIR